ncbi:MAG: hypothetical protein ACM3O5_07540 [Betaproteobacteria bacterium]
MLDAVSSRRQEARRAVARMNGIGRFGVGTEASMSLVGDDVGPFRGTRSCAGDAIQASRAA